MTKPNDQNRDAGLGQRVRASNVTAFVPRPRPRPANGQPPHAAPAPDAAPRPDNDDPGPSAA